MMHDHSKQFYVGLGVRHLKFLFVRQVNFFFHLQYFLYARQTHRVSHARLYNDYLNFKLHCNTIQLLVNNFIWDTLYILVLSHKRVGI